VKDTNARCHRTAFGVLPGLLSPQTTGQLVREAQRHLVQFTLQPMAELIAQEATDRLRTNVELDLVSPLQASIKVGGREGIRDDDRRLERREGSGLVARASSGGVDLYRRGRTDRVTDHANWCAT
jgi:hypothetical protein